MRRVRSSVVVCTVLLTALLALRAAGADAAGWAYATHPVDGQLELFTTVLRDAPKTLVTQTSQGQVWRFAEAGGWVKLADNVGGDPALYALDDVLYSSSGGGNGANYNHARPALRIREPGSSHPVVEPMTFNASACGRGHEPVFAFDSTGHGVLGTSSPGVAAVSPTSPAECAPNQDPRDPLFTPGYRWGIDGLTGTFSQKREGCVFGSPAATSTPGLFAWGCISSITQPDPSYEIVLEQADGTDKRTRLAPNARTLLGGYKHLELDNGLGVPTGDFIVGVTRPNLAYAAPHGTYVALASQTEDVGVDWFMGIRMFTSADEGATWIDHGRLCGALGHDCYGGSIVHDDARDAFSLTWLQRGGSRAEGFAAFHTVNVGAISGALAMEGDALVRDREELDAVDFAGIVLPADVWVNHGAYDGFVAVGYFKDGHNVYAYKQT